MIDEPCFYFHCFKINSDNDDNNDNNNNIDNNNNNNDNNKNYNANNSNNKTDDVVTDINNNDNKNNKQNKISYNFKEEKIKIKTMVDFEKNLKIESIFGLLIACLIVLDIVTFERYC
jgi:hypothetical protein